MDCPEKRTKQEIEQIPNFVDYLLETYKPKVNSAGILFANPLDYITCEVRDFLESEEEKQFLKQHGTTALSALGFQNILRIYMSKSDGFGICESNDDLKKALFSIYLDTGVDMNTLQGFVDMLVDAGLLIRISSLKTHKSYLTTVQQIFNWEYKQFSRASAREAQKTRREKLKQQKIESAELSAPTPTIQTQPTTPTTKSTPTKPVPQKQVSGEDFFDLMGSDDFGFYA